ncbi:unnamed protein product, partial [Polarella glacialis]
AACCVCMCCFMAHRDLRVGGVSSQAVWLGLPAAQLTSVLRAASLTAEPSVCISGMHTIAAIRADALLRHWRFPALKALRPGHEDLKAASVPTAISVRVACFPEEYSPCNFAVV